MGVAVADYDNDGFPDIFVAGVNRNILYHNNGDGTFTDVTAKAGVSGLAGGNKLWSVGAAWLDYDNDGLLDLFVSNYLDWSMDKNALCGAEAMRLSCSPALYQGLPDTLYRNNGDGTFTDVSAAAGISGHIGKGMGLAIADFDDPRLARLPGPEGDFGDAAMPGARLCAIRTAAAMRKRTRSALSWSG